MALFRSCVALLRGSPGASFVFFRGVALSALAASLGVAAQGLLAWALAGLFAHPGPPALLLVLGFLGLALGRSGLGALGEALHHAALSKVKLALQVRLWASSGAKDPRLHTEDLDALDPLFTQMLPLSLLALVVPLGVALSIALIDPFSGLVLLLVGPLMPLFLALTGGQARLRAERRHAILSRFSGRFLEILEGLPTLQVFGGRRRAERLLDQDAAGAQRITLSILRIAFLSALTSELVATLSTALIAVEVGFRLLWASVDFAPALAVLFLTPEFFRPLRALGAAFHASVSGREAIRRIERALDTAPPASRGSRLLPPGPIEVTLEGIHFCFGENPLLDGVEARIEAGKVAVIVGENGAGKSTLLRLILGVIVPSMGMIRMGGQPLYELDLGQRIGWVPQHPVLFDGSLAENLRLAAPGATKEELRAVLERVGLEALLKRDGLDAPLGEAGRRLSGGERQRLALARALLHGGQELSLLILDEPTAFLDTAHERRIARVIDELRGNVTVLITTHRADTRGLGDCVLRLAEGRLVEETSLEDGNPALTTLRTPPSPPGEGKAESSADFEQEEVSETDDAGLVRSILRPSIPFVLLSALFGLLTLAAGMGLTGLAAWLLSLAATHPEVSALALPAVGVRFFGLLRGPARYLERLLGHVAALEQVRRVRLRFVRALGQSLSWWDQRGDLLSRVVADAEAMDQVAVRFVAPSLIALGVWVLGSTVLWMFSPVLAVPLLLLMPLAGLLLPALAARLSQRQGARAVRERGQLTARVVEGLAGRVELELIGAAARWEALILESRARGEEALRATARWGQIGGALTGATADIATLCTLLLGAGLVAQAGLDPIALATVVILVPASFEAVQPLPAAFRALGATLVSARRLASQVSQSRATPPSRGPVEMPPIETTLRIHPLEHRLPGSGLLLRWPLGLELKRGEMVALSAPSGAGKTTLLRLLLGLLPRPEGSFFLGDRDLRGLDPDALLERFSYLPQESWITRGSVAENLILEGPRDPEAMRAALRRVGLEGWLEGLALGLDQEIRPDTISGGERQRLGLARALLKDTACFLLLDEPGAHLDPEGRRTLARLLRTECAERGVLLVSHDPELLSLADRVVCWGA